MGKYPEALDALATAQRLDASFAMTYYYLGNIHAIQGNPAQARQDYRARAGARPAQRARE